jgi:perosamine synthetase
MTGNEQDYVWDCLKQIRNQITVGPYVARFEKAFAEFIGTKHAVATMNGTVALHLILKALRVGPGDEVIVPNLTYVATANAVTYCGATPVFVDVDETWCMDPGKVRRAVTGRTRVILPVHLYGQPANMDELERIALENRILVVEDAAESFGATYHGKKTGSLGVAGTFSFFGNKTITTGEGGMITTDNDEFDREMRILRGQGVDPERRYWHTVIGFNYRMTDLQAAIGLAQLEQADFHIGKRRGVFKAYWDNLVGVREIEFQPCLPNTEHGYWMVVVTFPSGFDRDHIAKRMLDCGVETRPVFPPMVDLPMYHSEVLYPMSKFISQQGLCLPTHANLTRKDIDLVCGYLRAIVRE